MLTLARYDQTYFKETIEIMRVSLRSVGCATATILACAALAYGQSGTGTTALSGRVVDPDGKSIEGAVISLAETQTAQRRQATSDNEGKFRFVSLAVGIYDVEAAAAGFSTSRASKVELLVGETKSITMNLAVASSNTQITVNSNVEIVNDSDTSNAQVISSKAIEDLPIRGRNFVEFVQLTPNVQQEQNRFGLVVNGQRSINSNISVDGVDFNDSLQGGQRGGGPNESAYFFPQLAVREFQVVRDGASAEVGRTNSGYINVVTKSGSNQYHGAGFYANRNGAMTSPDAFGNDSSSNSQHQMGGSFGGALKKDELFFFAAIEKNLLTIPYTVKFNTPSNGQSIPTDIASQQGTFNQKNNPLVAFGRLDYQWKPTTTVNVQYTYAAQNGLNFGGASGQTTAASTNNTILNRASQGVKAAVSSLISPSLLNELRGQYAYDNRTQTPNSTLAEITINDLGTLGGNKSGTYIYNATRYQILDNLTWIRGAHTVKIGVDLNFNPQQQQRETNYGGVYNFATLTDYLAAAGGNNSRIQQYQQSIAANGTQGRYEGMQQDFSTFITDTFKVRSDLTITAGLRWEGQLNPQPTSPNPKYPFTGNIPHDLKMWQPRLGLAWNIGGKDRSVLRASAGLFDARTPAYLMQRVFTDNGLNTLFLDTATDPSILNFLKVPDALPSVPSGIKTPINNIYAFDPSFRNPRSGQMAVAFEQKIDRNTKVTVGFTRNSTWSLQRRYDVNLFAPTILSNGMAVYPTKDSAGNLVNASSYNPNTGAVTFLDSTGNAVAAKVARPDPTIGQINFNKSVAHSSYNGLSVTVQRRMSSRFQYALNYTHARSNDDDSNERDFNRQTAYNTYNLSNDAARSQSGVRDSGNMHALYDIGRGFTVSTLVMARTGMPVKPVVGSDLQNDGNSVNDRPVLNGFVAARDALHQPGFFDWDLRLLKEFRITERSRLTFSAEFFNITRSSNKTFNGDGETSFGKPQATVNPKTGYAYVNNTAGIPTLSPGTDRFGGPRQIQLGARIVF